MILEYPFGVEDEPVIRLKTRREFSEGSLSHGAPLSAPSVTNLLVAECDHGIYPGDACQL